MRESIVPEILRRPLSLTVASLLAMDVDPVHFDWIDAPEKAAFKAALDELSFLGALEDTGKISAFGQVVAALQVEPSMAKMLYEACQSGFGTCFLHRS